MRNTIVPPGAGKLGFEQLRASVLSPYLSSPSDGFRRATAFFLPSVNQHHRQRLDRPGQQARNHFL